MLYPLSYRRTQSTSIIPEFDEKEHRFPQIAQSRLATEKERRFSLKQAIEGYLLSCRVEGRSPAIIEAYQS